MTSYGTNRHVSFGGAPAGVRVAVELLRESVATLHMGARSGRFVDTVRTVVREIRSEDLPFMVGSIAYHAFVSLLPMLLLFVLVVSAVGSEALAAHVVDLLGGYAPASARPFLRNAIRRGSEGGSSAVGIVALVWGTFKIFRSLDAAFAEIYDTERRRSLLDGVRDGLVVLVALVVAIAVLGVLGTYVTIPANVPFAGPLTVIVSVVTLSIAFLPMYYVFPNVDVSVGEVLPGVAVAAVGWVALENLFHLYVLFTDKSAIYGFLGVILLFIIWLYASAFVLLLGATVNAVLAGRTGDRSGEGVRSGSGAESPVDPAGATGNARDERSTGPRSAEGFGAEIDRLVADARRNGLAAEDAERVLRKRADTVGGRGGERDDPA